MIPPNLKFINSVLLLVSFASVTRLRTVDSAILAGSVEAAVAEMEIASQGDSQMLQKIRQLFS